MKPTAQPQQTLDPAALRAAQRLDALLRAEAAARGGRLAFDRFMELALYAPGLGYYAGGAHKLGRGGDFVTAPELSPLFGRTLAGQCREVLERLGGGDVLELGAGSGALSVDLLGELAANGQLPGRYLILEVSAELRARQQAQITERVPWLAGRFEWLDRLPERFTGLVLANEVLDAMPVHRFRIGPGGEPLELFARPTAEGWAEVADTPESPGLTAAVRGLQAAGLAREPGYESELNLRLAPWVRALAESVERALLLLIDYGYPAPEYYHADRRGGTLMCHWRHRAHTDPYHLPGLQDITAHVDFSALARSAERAGFALAGYTTQAQFLLGCGIERLLAEAAAGPDALADLAAARQLLLPTAMGEGFRVLGLEKGVSGPWCGFSVRDLRERL
jgi:SAM-dependent MidA family methyltransferase